MGEKIKLHNLFIYSNVFVGILLHSMRAAVEQSTEIAHHNAKMVLENVEIHGSECSIAFQLRDFELSRS